MTADTRPDLQHPSACADWHLDEGPKGSTPEQPFRRAVRLWGAEAARYALTVYGVEIGELVTMQEAAAMYDDGADPIEEVIRLAQKYDLQELELD